MQWPRDTEDNAVHKIAHKMKKHWSGALAELAENFSIGLI